MTMLTMSALKTRCPYKGEANYFSLAADGKIFGERDLEL